MEKVTRDALMTPEFEDIRRIVAPKRAAKGPATKPI
jgi:hypothetical protein